MTILMIRREGGERSQYPSQEKEPISLMIWDAENFAYHTILTQSFCSGYDASGRVTLSFNEFDGQTNWSASCDGRHYWTILSLGDDD